MDWTCPVMTHAAAAPSLGTAVQAGLTQQRPLLRRKEPEKHGRGVFPDFLEKLCSCFPFISLHGEDPPNWAGVARAARDTPGLQHPPFLPHESRSGPRGGEPGGHQGAVLPALWAATVLPPGAGSREGGISPRKCALEERRAASRPREGTGLQ